MTHWTARSRRLGLCLGVDSFNLARVLASEKNREYELFCAPLVVGLADLRSLSVNSIRSIDRPAAARSHHASCTRGVRRFLRLPDVHCQYQYESVRSRRNTDAHESLEVMTNQPRNGQPATPRRRRNRRRLPDFHTAPGHLFRRGRQLHDALWLIHVDSTLTPLQYAVLTALELEPNIDQRTLGNRIALDKSTIGDLLARLSNRELIRRRSDDRDGRRRLLEVTEEGRDVLYRAAPKVAKVGEMMLSVLDDDEREELIRLMDKIVYSSAAQNLLCAQPPKY